MQIEDQDLTKGNNLAKIKVLVGGAYHYSINLQRRLHDSSYQTGSTTTLTSRPHHVAQALLTPKKNRKSIIPIQAYQKMLLPGYSTAKAKSLIGRTIAGVIINLW
jgi:hypothetical protein